MNQTTAVATTEPRLPMPRGLTEVDAGMWKVLVETAFPNAQTSASVVMALDYCRARKLDVLKRVVNIVPMWNSKLGREVETIWPSITEIQITAARTGQYAGLDRPEWGPDVTETFVGRIKVKGEWTDKSTDVTYPEWCAVTVYKMIAGTRYSFCEPVYWREAYGRMQGSDLPNGMWRKRVRGQLGKVAKAASLRAAFPEETGYVAEEMEGHDVLAEAGGKVIEHTPEPPPVPTEPSVPASIAAQSDPRTGLPRDKPDVSRETSAVVEGANPQTGEIGPDDKPPSETGERFLKWADEQMARVTPAMGVDGLQSLFNARIEPYVNGLIPPDRTALDEFYQRHEKRVSG